VYVCMYVCMLVVVRLSGHMAATAAELHGQHRRILG